MNGWPMVLEWGERNDHGLSGQTFALWFGSDHSRFITYSLIRRSLNTVHLISISTSVLRFVYTNRSTSPSLIRSPYSNTDSVHTNWFQHWLCSHQLIPILTLFTPTDSNTDSVLTPTDSNTDSVHTNWFQHWFCSHQLIPTLTLFTPTDSNTLFSHQLIPTQILFTPTDSIADSIHTNWLQHWLCSHQLIPTLILFTPTLHTNWFQH